MSGDSKPYTKPPLHLVPLEFAWAAAKAMRHGLGKGYERNSWRYSKEPGQYLGACLRHITAIMNGEDLDEEGQPHINGACASLAIYAWHVARGFRFGGRGVRWVVDDDQRDAGGATRPCRGTQAAEGAEGRTE